jgi:hypothetical protein
MFYVWLIGTLARVKPLGFVSSPARAVFVGFILALACLYPHFVVFSACVARIAKMGFKHPMARFAFGGSLLS